MIINILFIIFFFFTHKQLYSGSHFTGGSNAAGDFVRLVSLINLITLVSLLVYLIIKNSFIYTVILFIVSLIFTTLLNSILSKIAMRQTQNELILSKLDPLFPTMYNYKCDVLATTTALIGIVVNIIIDIVFATIIF